MCIVLAWAFKEESFEVTAEKTLHGRHNDERGLLEAREVITK